VCVTVELVSSVHTQVNIRKKRAATNIKTTVLHVLKSLPRLWRFFVFLFNDKFVYCTLDIANIKDK
jgi:hypothetical protein